MKRSHIVSLAFTLLTATACLQAGPYSKLSDDPTNTNDAPIAKADASIVAWGSNVVNYAPAPGVGASYQGSGTYWCLGDLYDPADPPATGVKPEWHGVDEVFNGNINDTTDSYGFVGVDAPGSITVQVQLGNGAGKDFAIFENGMALGDVVAADLAYVEVSTDGVNFARFDSISLNTELQTPFGPSWAAIDPTNVYNLAGKHASGWGTPFDLDELTGHDLVSQGLLDLNDINYVKLIDIPGSGDFKDSQGNDILDAWVTYNSGGFDYTAESIGIINTIPEPASLTAILCGTLMGLARSRRRK